MKYIDKILNSWKTVFRYSDMEILLGISNRNTLRSIFSRGSSDGIFTLLQKWVYGLRKYDKFELGSKLKTKSYISFETVLKAEWIIFQDYGNQIFLASDNNLKKTVDDNTFVYHKIKDDILMNPLWLIHKWSYTIASKERAVCDRIYLSKNYYFDNLGNIDVELLEEISQIYNKRVILAVKALIKDAK